MSTAGTGIYTIDDIRARCRIDDITGCWEWSMATASNRQKCSAVPAAWWPAKRRVVTAIRIAYELGRGKPPGAKVWRRCQNPLCVNPDHLMSGSVKQFGRWVERHRIWKDQGIERRIANRRGKLNSGRTVLTTELAQWAIESHQTGIDVAHALDVSPTSVSRARLGRTWAPRRGVLRRESA